MTQDSFFVGPRISRGYRFRVYWYRINSWCWGIFYHPKGKQLRVNIGRWALAVQWFDWRTGK